MDKERANALLRQRTKLIEELKTKNYNLESRIRDLENLNQSLISDLKNANSLIKDLESSTTKNKYKTKRENKHDDNGSDE